MFQQDYILRQIQEIIQVIARIIGLREEGSYEEARSHIETALLGVWNLHRKDLLDLSEERLKELCIVEGAFHTQFAIALADLLKEDGVIYEEEGKFFHAGESYKQARVINTLVLSMSNEIPFDIYDRIADLDAAISRNEAEV